MSEKTKQPVGRPTKYNDELQSLADTYIFSYKELRLKEDSYEHDWEYILR